MTQNNSVFQIDHTTGGGFQDQAEHRRLALIQ